MPTIVKHRCGEVLAVYKTIPSEDYYRRLHKENNDRCPKCGGKLAWKPIEVTVRPNPSCKKTLVSDWKHDYHKR